MKQLASKLREAGVETGSAALQRITRQALAEGAKNYDRTRRRFRQLVADHHGAMLEFIDRFEDQQLRREAELQRIEQNSDGVAKGTLPSSQVGSATSAAGTNDGGEADRGLPKDHDVYASSAVSPEGVSPGGGQRQGAHGCQKEHAPAKSLITQEGARAASRAMAKAAYERFGYNGKALADMTRSGLDHLADATDVLGLLARAHAAEMPTHDANAICRDWIKPDRSNEILAFVIARTSQVGALRLTEAS